jgi:glyoxylase-like metal-dependent hydrolase (beta-lactamase superfamily II)/rhodanese-related sulfurtransferase
MVHKQASAESQNASSLEGIEEISVEGFYSRISQPNDILLLDVRNESEYENWKIESRFTPETMHIPYTIFAEDGPYALLELPQLTAVPQDREILVVCAVGDASDLIAAILREEGWKNALNLTGGMIAWGDFYVTRPVTENEAYKIYQVDRVARGCLSYVLISDGKAAIIDPLRHIDRYEGFLKGKDIELSYLLDTHAHADHISGGPAISSQTGSPYNLHPYDGIHPFDMLPAVIEYETLADGQRFSLGALTIEVLHTPGHTLGQVNFIVTDEAGESYVFSGDNVFIQSFGRPDLGGQGKAWAPIVYETIYDKFKNAVDDETLVLPGHYATFDEADSKGLVAKKVADLWCDNIGLQFKDRTAFIDYVLDHLPQLPEQYVEIKRVNIGLTKPDEKTASELELGKNICALSDAYSLKSN